MTPLHRWLWNWARQPAVRTVLCALVFCAIFGAPAAAATATVSNPAPLTTAAAIRALSPDAARRSLPVALRVQVLHFLPKSMGHLVVMEGGVGIYVEGAPKLQVKTQAGDLAEIEGVTGPGDYAPVIHLRAFRKIGRQPLPEARSVSAEELRTGRFDCQWVQIERVVRSVRVLTAPEPSLLILDLSGGGDEAPVHMANAGLRQPQRLVDARVRVRGVCLHSMNKRRQAVGFHLHSSASEDLVIVRPSPGEPFEQPVKTIDKLLHFGSPEADGHRVRVQGVVTLARPGGPFFLTDNRHSIQVHLPPNKAVEVGQKLDVAGFPAMVDYTPRLEEASFRVLASAIPINAKPVRARAALSGSTDGELIQIDAELRSHVVRGAETVLTLTADGISFEALLPGAAPRELAERLDPGSLLTVVGVCAVQVGSSLERLHGVSKPASFHLLLRSADDLRLLALPSWWTRERLLGTLGAVALVPLMALGWAVWLHRKNAALAGEVRQQASAREAAEAVLRERNRLASELHDTLEQGITSIALQLEVIEELIPREPVRAGQHVQLAHQLLQQSRGEIRRSVWNLRSEVLEQNQLPAALEVLGRQLADCADVRLRIEVRGVPRRLPDLIENNLLRLGQEAITNAIKHAQTAEILVLVAFKETGVELHIEDDGAGFDPEQVAAGPGMHFGLQGMRERVKRLGGTIQIRSERGAGTRIVVAVPVAAAFPSLST